MPIGKRKDTGKWGYRHLYNGENYREHRWDTREEAVEAFKELLDKLAKQLPITDSNITLVEAINKFLQYSVRIGKSESRLRGLYSNFKSFIIPFFTESKRLKDITHSTIEDFIDAQLKRPITRNTINHYVIDLNSLLHWAVNEESRNALSPRSWASSTMRW